MAKTLSDYIVDAQRLLHDSSFRFYDQTELTDYANKARRMTAAVTACTRQLAAAVIINQVTGWMSNTNFQTGTRCNVNPQTSLYYVATSGGVSGSSQPTWPTTPGQTVNDGAILWTCVLGQPNTLSLTNDIIPGRQVLGCLDIYLWNLGLTRYPLLYVPFSTYNRRPEVMYQSPGTPSIWSQMNKTLFIAAPSNVVYYADLDVLVVPQDLVNMTDTDNDIPSPQDDLPGYYMAHLAKQKFQRRDQAQEYLADFYSKAMVWGSAEIQRRLVGQ